jgi:tetratricopeptide (TPR) repeat protein
LLGEIYVALDSLEKAEALYRRALNYDQNNTDILLALETVLYRQNRLDEAVKLLKSTQPEKVDRKKIESRLAADLFKMGRNEEAVSYYQNVIREDISHLYAAATSLALIYWQELKDPKKALNYVNLAGAVNPTAEIFSLKGAICEELGLKEESREAYRLAAELESSKSGAEEKVPSK